MKLAEVREVVCVTAKENYDLEIIERAGTTGWGKYPLAGISWAVPPPEV